MERPMGRSTARVIIHYGQCLPDLPGAEPAACSELMHLPVGQLAVESLLQVQRMVREVTVGSSSSDKWQSGRVTGTAAFQASTATESTRDDLKAFEVACEAHDVQVEEMRSKLRADGSQDMLDWEQRLGPTDLTDFPDNLKKAPPTLTNCRLPIPNPHVAVKTKWHDLPSKINLPVRDAPLGWLSSVRPRFRAAARDRVCSFRKKLTAWMNEESERPYAAVIPGSWLEHWVFEATHDFHSCPGKAIPVDTSEASKSHLNLDFYKQQGEGYPDQEILSFLVLGVHYKANLPVQIVLQPHLQSFLPVQAKYLAEADRFVERGWTVVHESIPLVPFFSAACGSVCRPLEPDRPRPTNDAGAPRKELWADDGVRVRSLNECIAEMEWPKEVKPDALAVATAIRVLKEAADMLGMSVFIITDDYASFFNQMRLAKGEYCKIGVMHPPREGEQMASFAYDTVLGFGIKMASNVAQRFADFLVYIFKKTIKPIMQSHASTLAMKNPEFATWWQEREGLGDWQATLVAMTHAF